MRKIIEMMLISLTGALLNIAIGKICVFLFGLPLFLDTIFTITVTLSCGLMWGAICGTLTNLISHTIFGVGFGGYLFSICNAATALVVWLFMRLFPRELNFNPGAWEPLPAWHKSSRLSMIMDKLIVLILLSFALCLVMSILGGLIASIILSNSAFPVKTTVSAAFSSSISGQNLPLILTEIFSRIPVNIIDRLISAFAGFCIAYSLRSFFRFSSQSP